MPACMLWCMQVKGRHTVVLMAGMQALGSFSTPSRDIEVKGKQTETAERKQDVALKSDCGIALGLVGRRRIRSYGCSEKECYAVLRAASRVGST